MKNKATLHDENQFNNSSPAGNQAIGPVWKLGLDVDRRQIAVAMQCERGTIGPALKFSRAQFIAWVKQKAGQIAVALARQLAGPP
jgi:hypothetical protein